MYFSAVELPHELIQAHRDGNLVIFVGAGASRAEPSGLPDFRRLASDVAAAVHATDLDLEEDPDILLGRLAEAGIDVNRLVADRLKGGEPNDLHRAIVALASAGSDLRIVTTNYDRHLSAAIDEAGLTVDEYRAPALPMGDDIDGLVYLHGALDRAPRHLIVTDRDFGRAYLRDAWAARFLERMYSTYTVLFVGYSVSDVVMRYLARSLSDSQPRFAFTSAPSNDDWRRLGISPLGYEAVGPDHSHLVGVVAEWATEASRGLLDHRQRVRELVASPPTGIPDEESYLEATVVDATRVRFFTEFAEHPEWLAWIRHKKPFPTLFDRRSPLEPVAHELARWLVDRFVLDQDRTSAALAAVRGAGGGLSPDLWWVLGRELKQSQPRPSWLGPWMLLLVEQAPPRRQEWLEYLLAEAELPAERSAAILLFDCLTQPQGNLEPSVFLDARPTVEASGSEHWLREAWQNRLAPALPHIAPEILAIADRHLRRAHQLLALAAGHDRPFDPIHFRRSAIHAHAQDSHPDALDVLLDAARDSLEAALDAEMAIAHGYLETWISCQAPLLRRLAVHGWSYRSDHSATDKLDWLLQHVGPFADDVQAEAYHLLRQTVGDTDESTAARLVDAIEEGPDLDDPVHRDRSRFDILGWVLETRPDLPGAEQLIERIQARHPEWKTKPHPELKSHVETGIRQPQLPMSVKDLHRLVTEDPRIALNELQPYRESKFSMTEPTWDDVLSLISATVREHPADGLSLTDRSDPDVSAAVVQGWSQAKLSPEMAQQVLDQLIDVASDPLAPEIADLLSVGGRHEDDPTPWPRYVRARELATQLWDRIDATADAQPTDDWLGRAINHPAGKLAQFWLNVVASDWQDAPDTWPGLSLQVTEALEQMLTSGDIRTHLAEPVLASQLRLLHGADAEWTEQHILPLLSWESPERAVRAWHGYLYWGRPTRQLLDTGLLEHYLETARHANDFRDSEVRRQLARHLAGIATSPVLNLGRWVTRFIASADEELGDEWAEAISWLLKDLPKEEVEAQWVGWLKPYWQGRISGVPRPLTRTEASAMASWVPHLGAAFPEAVELAIQTPASLDQDRLLLRDIADRDASTADHSEPVAILVAHLLEHATETLWDCETLHRIVDQVRAGAPASALTSIREHAFRLGCSKAPSW